MSVDREAIEAQLAKALGSSFKVEFDHLMEYLGDPPDLNNIPSAYWDSGWRAIQKAAEPILLDAYVASVGAIADQYQVGFSWDVINMEAVDWARNHSETVLKELFNKTYDGVSEMVPRYFEEDWSIDELANRLERWYSPVRAEMIAVTETTRAVVEGEKLAVRELEKMSGKRMIAVWYTGNDERVCPICAPRHKQTITDGVYPPAHPRCRCTVGWEFVKEQIWL